MRIIKVNIPRKEYDIVIEKGLFEGLGNEIKKVYKSKTILIVTDSNLYDLYHAKLNDFLIKENFIVHFVVIESGEESKSIKTLEYVYSKLAHYQITRSDLILAFGGGVVGDLAGFAASTYMRGISYIQVPTSLLAQIDSSIGGKVAINLKEGKNLAGSFYQPLRVLIDPNLLLTLPEKYLKDGLGEVIKYACIKDFALFNTLMSINSRNELFDNMENIIHVCTGIKAELVEKDEKDTGFRMVLNFGHTIGHAIEKHMDYQIGHGEAVAIGMLYITKNSQLLGYTEAGTYESIKSMLDHLQINYGNSTLKTDDIIEYINLDKKNLSTELNLILLKRIGEAFIHKVSHDEVKKFISL